MGLYELDKDIYSRLADFCTCIDGSISDLVFKYEDNRLRYFKSPLRFEYMDRPSHLFVMAYKKVLRDYGYERKSLP